ncbi:MAG: SH3 domain-containing protein, partial [Anaerolineae bacterium]|nr:SH3 domain-containing protein [Anaerolineae bacterium]
MKYIILVIALSLSVWMGGAVSHAQETTELAATLEVLEEGVEVLRVNTANWLPIRLEAIVGVGDMIRTNDTGRARITFFEDGTDTELLPNTTYQINRFEAVADGFTLEAEVVLGQTLQRLGRLLDANSNYTIRTPGMTLVARGTVFRIRVEQSERSAMLVDEGLVDAGNESQNADVGVGFGIRAQADSPLSDVVRATTFEQLDSALDGCPATITTPDDVTINIRTAPNRDADIIGGVFADTITTLYGRTESTKWYRIMLDDGFGWILSSSAQIGACAGLRVFADDFAGENGVDTPPSDTPPAESTPEAP